MTGPHDDADARMREFVRAAHPRLVRTAHLLCADPHDAEDLAQAALVKVVRAWHRIERRDEPYAYARAVLVNTAASRWRRRRRYDELTAADRPPDPVEDLATGVVLRDAVRRALFELPPRARAVLVLRYFEDLSEAETAAALGIGTGTVKSQTSRALARLRTVLDAEDLTPVRVPAAPAAVRPPDRAVPRRP